MSKSKSKVELLETTDIFDLYGCEIVLNNNAITKDDKSILEFRIDEIHAKYLYAARERIKSECRFLGISEDEFDTMSFSQMLTKLSSMLEQELTNQSDKMMKGGHFNGLQSIVNIQRAAGEDLSGIDLSALGIGEPEKKEEVKTNSINAESLIKDPKWHIIAKAFQDLEDAQTTTEKILSVDYLNDLQHNSFHLLIDLQTGRMLEGASGGGGYGKHGEAVDIVKEVLDIKHNSASPTEYTDKMSREIAKMVTSYARI